MPKGSTTRVGNNTIPAGTTESRKRMAQWRQDIRDMARLTMGDEPPFAGGIRLMVEFRLPVPMSSMRKYQWGWLPHTKKPDVDKLFRMLGDAMTGIVWRDDSQVCYSSINKVYAWDGRPGAMVIAEPVTDEAAKRFANTASVLREAIANEPR